MSSLLAFPVDYSFQEDREIFSTFETIAIPPPHALVTSIHGWIFSGEELLLVHGESGWDLPGCPRRPEETFRETLVRTAWESSGALLGEIRMLGAVKIAEQHHVAPPDGDTFQAPDGQISYNIWFLAEARDVLPFSHEFEARDRMLIEPGLVPNIVKHWSPLLQEMLEYAQTIRTPAYATLLVLKPVAIRACKWFSCDTYLAH